jgi:SPP1 family predicted phage head-tail adaptor
LPLTLAQKLRDRITLLAPTDDQDGTGRPEATTTYATNVYAGIEELPQQDSQIPGQQNFQTTLRTRITVRHDPNIRSNFFAVATSGRRRGQTYTVGQVVDPGVPTRGVFLELWCKLMDDGLSPPN